MADVHDLAVSTKCCARISSFTYTGFAIQAPDKSRRCRVVGGRHYGFAKTRRSRRSVYGDRVLPKHGRDRGSGHEPSSDSMDYGTGLACVRGRANPGQVRFERIKTFEFTLGFRCRCDQALLVRKAILVLRIGPLLRSLLFLPELDTEKWPEELSDIRDLGFWLQHLRSERW